MVMYEYLVVNTGFASLDDTINEHAANGWRLVACPNYANILKAIFERPIKTDAPEQELRIEMVPQRIVLEEAGQMKLSEQPCQCQHPTGVIGSNLCMRCHGVIKNGE